jgi:uncharacterized repeat protein (TIGR04138 family)
MADKHKIMEAVERIVQRDPRYARAAYFFIHLAVLHSVEQVAKAEKRSRHISGQELLEGIRQFAIEQFGPLVLLVFHYWRIRCSRDIGEIVFLLAEEGILGVSDEDSIEDFENVYDFQDVFRKPFEPLVRRFPRVSLSQLEESSPC